MSRFRPTYLVVAYPPAVEHPHNVGIPAFRLGQGSLGVGALPAVGLLYYFAAVAALPSSSFVLGTSTRSTAAGCIQSAPLPLAPSPWIASHACRRAVPP